MIDGAELRVHFLKSFQKGSTCENLSQKGLKNKKDGHRGGGSAGEWMWTAPGRGWSADDVT
jgi:hypothetical protein